MDFWTLYLHRFTVSVAITNTSSESTHFCHLLVPLCPNLPSTEKVGVKPNQTQLSGLVTSCPGVVGLGAWLSYRLQEDALSVRAKLRVEKVEVSSWAGPNW